MGGYEHRYVCTVVLCHDKSGGDRNLVYSRTAGGWDEATTEETKNVNVHS